MVSSTRQTITCILLILVAAVYLQAQTTAEKVVSGSINGKVTIKGKPAVRVIVLANAVREARSSNTRGYRAKTDQAGTYHITNLAAGTYEISTITPALVPANQSGSIVVSEGEQVEDVDLSLVPGGVITGKITDSDGEPLIGYSVGIAPVFEYLPSGFNSTLMTRIYLDNRTDDRGVYRVFGLPPGKYKVSVGESGTGRKSSKEYYRETFYPSVSDAAKATVIVITEGSEADHIDIVLGRPVGTFRVAGRLLDGETGKPIPNIRYGVGQRIDYGSSSSSSSSSGGGDVTNANGEFLLGNVTPGKYTIFTTPEEGSGVPPASVTFEVVDRDLTDLVIRTTKGSSLSGVVVFDGNEKPAMLSGLRIVAAVKSADSAFTNAPASTVSQDGTFTINGVRSGLAHFWVYSSDNQKQFEIVRVECNGVAQSEINLKDEHVTGIRVVLKYLKLTGAIRGQVKVENGELPPPSQLWLLLWPLDENLEMKRSSSIESPSLDARGRFFAERLPAGIYQLTVQIYDSPKRNKIAGEKTQQVTVTDDTVTEVTVSLKLQSSPN